MACFGEIFFDIRNGGVGTLRQFFRRFEGGYTLMPVFVDGQQLKAISGFAEFQAHTDFPDRTVFPLDLLNEFSI